MQNIFEVVKSAVTPRQAAEAYGLTVSRGDMACCPFHNDKTPSMKLYEDHFYCFGCGAAGDVVTLTAQLLGLGPYEAAKRLVRDFGLDPDKPPTAAALPKPRETRSMRDDAMYCFRVLNVYRHLLIRWREEYAPKHRWDPWDQCFVEALRMLDRITYYVDCLIEMDAEDRAKVVKNLMESGLIRRLEAFLIHIGKIERASHPSGGALSRNEEGYDGGKLPMAG